MAIPRKGARKIVVSGLILRWTVASSDPPDLTLVAEDQENPASRALLHVPYGIRITPRVAASVIQVALDSGWNPKMRGSDTVIRFTIDMIADPQSAVHQCPCCDYFSLSRRGEYEICPICFWEDSGQDIDHIDMHSGPNRMTLREARIRFAGSSDTDPQALGKRLSPEERAAYRLTPRTP